jgi:Ca-activated chloride channel family protein
VVLYNLGNAFYKSGHFAAAQEHYNQALARVKPALKPRVLYNLGNSAYRQGRLEEAIQDYENALTLAPDDAQARDNLAFVKKKLEEQKQHRSQQPRDDTGRPPKDNAGQPQAQDQAGQQASAPKGQPGPAQQEPSRQGKGSGQQGQQAGPPHGAQMSSADQQRQGREAADQAASAPAGTPSQTPPEPSRADQQAAGQILNRLKDEPGRALMPMYQKRRVERDW